MGDFFMETRKKDQNIMVNQLVLKQKNVLKVFIIAINIILLLFFNVTVCYADLEDDEEIDVEEIKKEVVQASANIAEEPKLNAK